MIQYKRKVFLLIFALGILLFTTNVYAQCDLTVKLHYDDINIINVNYQTNNTSVDLTSTSSFFYYPNNYYSFDSTTSTHFFKVNKNNTINLIENYRFYKIVFKANDCDGDNVVIKLNNNWIFNFDQTNNKLREVLFETNNITKFDLNGKNIYVNTNFTNDNGFRDDVVINESLIDDLDQEIFTPETHIPLRIIFDVNISNTVGCSKINISEASRHFYTTSNNCKKKPYGVDLIFLKDVVVDENATLSIEMSSDDPQQPLGISKNNGFQHYANNISKFIKNHWFYDYPDDDWTSKGDWVGYYLFNNSINKINPFYTFIEPAENYKQKQLYLQISSIKNYLYNSHKPLDGTHGHIYNLLVKGAINNFGEFNVNVFGGAGSNGRDAQHDDGTPKTGGTGGTGGDVSFSFNKFYNYRLTNINLEGGVGGTGGIGSRVKPESGIFGTSSRSRPSGLGGFGGSAFLNTSNIYNQEASEANIVIKSGDGGNGGQIHDDCANINNGPCYAGMGGHAGHVSININKIYNNNSTIDLKTTAGKGGDGGLIVGDSLNRDKDYSEGAGYGGIVFLNKFNNIYNVDGDLTLEFVSGLGGVGAEDSPRETRHGSDGSMSDILIENLANYSDNFKIIKRAVVNNGAEKYNKTFYMISTNLVCSGDDNEYSRSDCSIFSEWNGTGGVGAGNTISLPKPTSGDVIVENMLEGSVLPQEVSLDGEGDLEAVSSISIDGCYVNNLFDLSKTIDYSGFSNLSITSANNDHFKNKICFSGDPEFDFKTNCNFCQATDLKNELYRTDKKLYVYSNIDSNINSLEINYWVSGSVGPSIYINKDSIPAEYDENLELYKYELSIDTLEPNNLPFWYSSDYEFESDDRLFCYGQRYFMKITFEDDTEFTSFPFTVLFEDY